MCNLQCPMSNWSRITSSALQWLASVSQFGPLSGIGRCKENLSPLSSYLDFGGCWCFWLDCSILIVILIWPMIITRFMSWILPLFTVLEIAKNFNVLHTFLKNAGGSSVGFSVFNSPDFHQNLGLSKFVPKFWTICSNLCFLPNVLHFINTN